MLPADPEWSNGKILSTGVAVFSLFYDFCKRKRKILPQYPSVAFSFVYPPEYTGFIRYPANQYRHQQFT